jgi:hypothetical protein
VITTTTVSRLNFDQFGSPKRYYFFQHSQNNREQETFDYVYPLYVIIISPLSVKAEGGYSFMFRPYVRQSH